MTTGLVWRTALSVDRNSTSPFTLSSASAGASLAGSKRTEGAAADRLVEAAATPSRSVAAEIPAKARQGEGLPFIASISTSHRANHDRLCRARDRNRPGGPLRTITTLGRA